MIVIRNRNALGTPFQSFDCHIPNHSPPIDMKPTCQSKKPSVSPATANVLARLNADASARRLRASLPAPIQHSAAVAASAAMISAYPAWCSAGLVMARYLMVEEGKTESIDST